MTRRPLFTLIVAALPAIALAAEPVKPPKVDVGQPAPAFKIKDPTGKVIDLAELTAKGPVLVRLTCGCSGCDKELAYFQKLDEAYKGQGLISLYVFKEPDEKMAKYAAEKKLEMLYAVDPKGESWTHVPDQDDADQLPDRQGREDRRHRVRLRRERVDCGRRVEEGRQAVGNRSRRRAGKGREEIVPRGSLRMGAVIRHRAGPKTGAARRSNRQSSCPV